MESLKKELAYFEKHRAEWVKTHAGKFALIKNQTLVGFFDSQENAYGEGVKRFGNQAFLIKQVLEDEPKHHIPALSFGVIDARF